MPAPSSRTAYKIDMIHKTEYIFGLRAVIEAIDAGKKIDKVLIRKDLAGGELSHELMEKIKQNGIVMQRVPLEKLNRITMKNHQGAIALLSMVSYHSLSQIVPSLYEEGMLPFILLLDGITDTRNFGAIAHTRLPRAFHSLRPAFPQRERAAGGGRYREGEQTLHRR